MELNLELEFINYVEEGLKLDLENGAMTQEQYEAESRKWSLFDLSAINIYI